MLAAVTTTKLSARSILKDVTFAATPVAHEEAVAGAVFFSQQKRRPFQVQRQNQQEINLAPGAIPALPHQKTKIKAFTCSSRSSLVQNALRPT